MAAARKAGPRVRQTRYLYSVSQSVSSHKGGGRERGGDNSHNKIRIRKHIIPHQHPGHIPNNLQHQPPRHRDQKSPRLVPDAQPELDQKAHAEERGEEGVAAEGGEVGHHAEHVALELERAGACCAEARVEEEGDVEGCEGRVGPVGDAGWAGHGGGLGGARVCCGVVLCGGGGGGGGGWGRQPLLLLCLFLCLSPLGSDVSRGKVTREVVECGRRCPSVSECCVSSLRVSV